MRGRDDRLLAIAQMIRLGADIGMINSATKIDMFFLDKIYNIVAYEETLRSAPFDADVLRQAKRMGFFGQIHRHGLEQQRVRHLPLPERARRHARI